MSSIRTLDLYRIFDKLDKNGDGLVSLEELMWLLESVGAQTSPDELKLLVGQNYLDPIDFVLFHGLIVDRNNTEERKTQEAEEGKLVVEKDLLKAFQIFDSDGDGFISSEELKSALCRLGLWDEHSCGKDSCMSMINVYDTNRDGKLDFEEFKNMMLD